jgi:hypothetical protein
MFVIPVVPNTLVLQNMGRCANKRCPNYAATNTTPTTHAAQTHSYTLTHTLTHTTYTHTTRPHIAHSHIAHSHSQHNPPLCLPSPVPMARVSVQPLVSPCAVVAESTCRMPRWTWARGMDLDSPYLSPATHAPRWDECQNTGERGCLKLGRRPQKLTRLLRLSCSRRGRCDKQQSALVAARSACLCLASPARTAVVKETRARSLVSF